MKKDKKPTREFWALQTNKRLYGPFATADAAGKYAEKEWPLSVWKIVRVWPLYSGSAY